METSSMNTVSNYITKGKKSIRSPRHTVAAIPDMTNQGLKILDHRFRTSLQAAAYSWKVSEIAKMQQMTEIRKPLKPKRCGSPEASLRNWMQNQQHETAEARNQKIKYKNNQTAIRLKTEG